MPLPLSTPVIAVHTAPKVISTFFTHFHQAHKRKQAAKKKKNNKRAIADHAGEHGFGATGASADGLDGRDETGEIERPTTELSYREGLEIVKKFLATAKSHTLEELQAFTAMHVPYPRWIHLTHVTIHPESISQAAKILTSHFKTFYGPDGLRDIGGGEWWKLRGRNLEGEWIEMKKDFLKRTTAKVSELVEEDEKLQEDGGAKRAKQKGDRVILYVHGGAYFFSSLDTHRYQIQRHARKLGGRAFAPSYRLAPQYPFPCGLHDCLAAYLFLLNPPEGSSQEAIPASNIIFSGDSAGAGLLLSLLVLIRDSGGSVPMPAGACLISPWVDLTHSMKSIMGPDEADYIPSEGFHYQPSAGWPPLKGEGIELSTKDETGKETTKMLDDQVQLYANNRLISHPLVSPINQGSLGGLCPLMIMGGSGELLRDEMTFVAHKAANPEAYPPSATVLAKYPKQAELVSKYPPTKVHLQMYDGCAHVTPTLSFTRPAKWMYRAAASFNIWAITTARLMEEHHGQEPARKRSHDHHHHHDRSDRKSSKTSASGSAPNTRSSTVSLEDSSPTADSSAYTSRGTTPATTASPSESGDHVPSPTIARDITESIHAMANDEDNVSEGDASSMSSDSEWDSDDPPFPEDQLVMVTGAEKRFINSMIRERISVKGRIREMEPVEESETFQGLDLDTVGAVHGDGPIVKWMKAREEWDHKFSKQLAKHRAFRTSDRELAAKNGYLSGLLPNDTPPLCSLAGFHDEEAARAFGKSVDEVGRRGQSVSGLLGAWMKLGQKKEEERAGDDEVRKMEKQLEEIGIDKDTQKTIGDKSQASVVRHLAKEGVDLKDEVDPGMTREESARKSLDDEVRNEVGLGATSHQGPSGGVTLGKAIHNFGSKN